MISIQSVVLKGIAAVIVEAAVNSFRNPTAGAERDDLELLESLEKYEYLDSFIPSKSHFPPGSIILS